MLSLAFHGKIPITEDVLTAAFFDLVAERRDAGLMKAILESAHRRAATPAMPDPLEVTVELWPKTPAGEPDVRVRLSHADAPIITLLVEAKLGAPKSGTGEVTEDRRSGDQLARYLLAESATDPNVFLLYLTHHAAIPDKDLEESILYLRKAGRDDLVDRVLWTSWRSVERQLAANSAPDYERIRALLRRVRMFWFDGIRTDKRLALRTTPRFYRSDPITYAWPAFAPLLGAEWRYEGTGRVRGEYAWESPSRLLRSEHFYGGNPR